MNYRHVFHAGNFADVVKHLALVSALLHLRRKDKPVAVFDTHAGCGRYDLAGAAANRTGEAQAGIGRLAALPGRADLPEALRTYLEIAFADGPGCYPGSPLFAARMLRPQDRLVAIEKHPDEAAALRAALAPFGKARAVEADGYARLPALLPPPERRGLILIDPPYEAADEFRTAAAALAGAWRRFATGIYMLWFPIKSTAAADAFCGEALAAGIEKALRIDVELEDPPPGDGKARMRAAGLLVVNPPYGLAEDMQAAAALAMPLLGARFQIARLVGEA